LKGTIHESMLDHLQADQDGITAYELIKDKFFSKTVLNKFTALMSLLSSKQDDETVMDL